MPINPPPPLGYCRGTHILTMKGEVAIENLSIGDEVVTRFSGSKKIKWIGRQTYPVAAISNAPNLCAVRIDAGAMGQALPRRPLLISPGHALLLGETLIAAENLMNGVTIAQDKSSADAQYLHLEFDEHDCILAEGIWSESFAGGPKQRAYFENNADYSVIYPNHPEPDEIPACRPKPSPGPALAAALEPVIAHANRNAAVGELHGYVDDITPDGLVRGWAWDEENQNSPVCLSIILHGTKIATFFAYDYRGDLKEAGYAEGFCSFTHELGRKLSTPDMHALQIIREIDGEQLRHTPTTIRLSALSA